MSLESLRKTLLNAARHDPPSDRAPYAFERRVMAQVRAIRSPDGWSVWAAGLWRAAFPCLAVAALLVGANLMVPDRPKEIAASDTLEVALFAAADSTPEF